jgi:hypothetical protein
MLKLLDLLRMANQPQKAPRVGQVQRGAMGRLRRVKNHEQQLQGPREADQDKTDSYCLDRR